MGDEEEELLGIWGITKSWSLDIDLCNGPIGALHCFSMRFLQSIPPLNFFRKLINVFTEFLWL